MSDKHLSKAVAEGWAIVTYAVNDMGGMGLCHNVLLERHGQHKVLTMRKKMMGEGLVVEELEI